MSIEQFAEFYALVPMIVTARRAGYSEAALREELFATYTLSGFSDSQVAEYAHRWFVAQEDLDHPERQRRAKGFLVESASVGELRRNPLLLALMCNLYNGVGYIPRNRPDLYRKCSELLFERWDRGRGIRVGLEIGEPRALLAHLAEWLFHKKGGQAAATERALVRESVMFLSPRRYVDPEEAERHATAFVNHCKGRAWVFTDVGSFGGENLYAFTHKTFLEYFTAVAAVRRYRTEEALWDALRPRIGAGGWEVIAPLAFQIFAEQTEDGADALLLRALTALDGTDACTEKYLAFILECLHLAQCRPSTLVTVVRATIGLIAAPPHSETKNGDVKALDWPRILALLVTGPKWTRPSVGPAILETIVDRLRVSADKTAIAIMDAGLLIRSLAADEARGDDETVAYWTALDSQIRAVSLPRLEFLARDDEGALTLLLTLKPEIGVKTLIQQHGGEGLFRRLTGGPLSRSKHPPVVERLMVEWNGDEAQAEWGGRAARAACEEALRIGMPWIRYCNAVMYDVAEASLSGSRPDWALKTQPESRSEQEGLLDGTKLVGYLFVFGSLCELMTSRRRRDPWVSIARTRLGGRGLLAGAIRARWQALPGSQIVAELQRRKAPAEAVSIIEKWLAGTLDFVNVKQI